MRFPKDQYSIDDFQSAYPKVFSQLTYIECNVGWFYIINALANSLEKHINKLNIDEDICFTQIKEKFGLLRVYTSYSDDVINSLIDMAEKISSNTCEICGCRGFNISINKWCYTRCDECFKAIKLGR